VYVRAAVEFEIDQLPCHRFPAWGTVRHLALETDQASRVEFSMGASADRLINQFSILNQRRWERDFLIFHLCAPAP